MGAPDEQLRKGCPHFARLTLKEVLGDARRRVEEEKVSKLLAHAGAEFTERQQRLVPVGRRASQRLLRAPTDGEEEPGDKLKQFNYEQLKVVALQSETESHFRILHPIAQPSNAVLYVN